MSEISSEQQFIPNDYFVYNYIDAYDNDFQTGPESYINKDFSNKLTVLTGPNFSGKSIYLKQVEFGETHGKITNSLIDWDNHISLSYWIVCSCIFMQNWPGGWHLFFDSFDRDSFG